MSTAPIRVEPTPLVLRGLDGSNPLGFLAALGTLRLLVDHCEDPADEWRRATLGWTQADGGWRAVLGPPHPVEPEALASRLASAVATMMKEPPFERRLLGDGLRVEPARYRELAVDVILQPERLGPLGRWAAALPAYGSELTRTRDGECEKTSLDFTAGNQNFLGIARAVVEKVTAARLERALFSLWVYPDSGQSLRWDPADEARQYALSAVAPADTKARTDFAAQSLALSAIPLLTIVRGRSLLFGPARRAMRWPIWNVLASIDVVRSILAGGLWNTEGASPQAAGVACVYESPVVLPADRYRNLAPSRRVM